MACKDHRQTLTNSEEEGQSGGDAVYVQASLLGGASVLDTVYAHITHMRGRMFKKLLVRFGWYDNSTSYRECQFEFAVSPSLLDVVSTDAYAVELRHVVAATYERYSSCQYYYKTCNTRAVQYLVYENIS